MIVVSVKSAQRPLQTRNVYRGAKTRTDRVLGNSARKVGWANASRNSQPRERLEFFIQKVSLQATGGMLSIGKRQIPTPVVCDFAKEPVVMLGETLQPQLKIVFREIGIAPYLTS